MSDKIVQSARDSFKADKQCWANAYKKAREDMKFLSDDPHAQWDSADYEKRIRTGRPAITVDQLGQFIHQVANDIRMNTPTINVFPSDHEGSEEQADALKGLIREIEYYSNADDVYDTASLSAIKCSIGWIRVNHKYEYGKDYQRLCLERVVNPLAVYIDGESIEADGKDATKGYVLDKITVKEFNKRFPKKEPVCFENEESQELSDEDTITLCEYYEKEGETVNRYLMSGKEILEENETPFKYIPLVPVYGEEAWVDGKRELYSLIRKSKQAQQRYNYWVSLETELLQKAPKAPVMVPVGQIEDFAEDWMNPDEAYALRYKYIDEEGNLLPQPQRLEPPSIPMGVINAARQSVEDIKASMGIYNAGLGMQSNEISGVAITNRQRESDTATYHFSDNLSRSIAHVGRILLSAIPVIYDTPRILRIIGADEEQKIIGVNGEIAENQEATIDITTGNFNVRVSTGASFSTKRQEAATFLSQLVNNNPQLMTIMGDLMFKNMDFAGASAMSERIKKIMDPSVFEEQQDPMVAQMQQQIQQLTQTLQAMQAQLESKQQEIALKQQAEQNDAINDRAKLEVQLEELRFEREKAGAELRIRERELELKAIEIQQDRVSAGQIMPFEGGQIG